MRICPKPRSRSFDKIIETTEVIDKLRFIVIKFKYFD